MTKHSFAVMAYGDSPFLIQCLDSLKSQTIKSQIFIATSTVSDYILDIAKKYEVNVFVTEPGQGIAHDWNFSLHSARTKYVTLAHQDDLYLPEYTETCLASAEKFKDTLICFTNYAEIVAGKTRSANLLLRVKRFILFLFMPFRKYIRSKRWKKTILAIGSPISTPSVMYHLENLDNFQFSPEFSVSIDWDAWSRMAEMKGRFVYITKTLMRHRIHSGSATTAGIHAKLRQQEDLRMYKRYWPGFIARLLVRLYARSYKSNDDSRN